MTGNTLTDGRINPADFDFPLNIYACLLFLQEGKEADHLHLALYLREGLSFPKAQKQSSRLIWPFLPPPPGRILDVGIGTGTTTELLADEGYRVHRVSPYSTQAKSTRTSIKDKVQSTYQNFEDFKPGKDQFELILFQKSAQYIDPLTLFNRASELLSDNGKLLILDEFALRRTEPGPENLHLLDDFTALGRRFGFALLEQRDLTRAAAPIIDFVLQGTLKHRQLILKKTCITAEELDQFDHLNQLYRNKYTSGRFGYALLCLQKKHSPKWRIGELNANHSPEFTALFTKIFGHSAAQSFWLNKYGNGRGHSLAVWNGETLVGHYGGQERNILFHGRPELAVQNCDVMVEATNNKGLSRQGPYFLMITTFLERYVGYGRKYLIAFGFPNARAMRTAKIYGLYEVADKIVQISWPAATRHFSLLRHTVTVTKHADLYMQRQINNLWREMAKDLKQSIVGVRNWKYLKQRYFDCPDRKYHVVMIKRNFGKAPYGVLVVREEATELLLLDIIAPLKHFPGLIRRARKLAADFNTMTLKCWITRSHQETFLTNNAETHETDITIPGQQWTAGPELSQVRNRWWLTAGDTDFL